jgi:hypothetical protein
VRRNPERRNERNETMKCQEKLAALKVAVAELVDAVSRDEGGFCLEALHAMVRVCEIAGIPDPGGVTAATEWTVSGGGGDENVRFFGEGTDAATVANVERN